MSDNSSRSFFIEGVGTVRECIGCKALVLGGPTRCVRCAIMGDPAVNYRWVRLRNLPPGFVFVTHDGILAVKSEYGLNGRKCMCILLGSGEYTHFVDDTLVRALAVQP